MAKYINSLEFEENNASTFSAESYMNRGKDFHGKETTASTILGSACSANGDYSVAAGIGTQAGASASTVVGKYNTKVCADNAFVVGNGTTGKTSDAFVVDWKGNVSAWGNVYASGCELAKVKNYYNKDEIGDMLSKLGSFVVVSAGSITPDIAGKQLNPEDAKTTNIYLEGPFTLHEHVNDAYKEWIVTGEIGSKQWTMIGTTEVDICDLMKKVEGGDKLKDHIGILNEKGEIIDSGKSIEEVGNYSAGDHIEISDDKVISVSGVKEYKNSDSIEYTVDGNDVSFIVNENWLKEHAGSNYTAGEHIEISDDNIISVSGAKNFNSVSLSASEDDDNINIEVNEDWLANHVIAGNSYLNRAITNGCKTNDEADDSYALGVNASALGHYSFAEGYQTLAEGYYSHVEGQKTSATINMAHAEGGETLAAGQYSHAEGGNTIASGDYSHTEGNETSALGTCSHAEGLKNLSDNKASHAEGIETSSFGEGSHAEGYQTIASNYYSHAEGYKTIAAGNFSHAEGENTSALADYSHAEGIFTLVSGIGFGHAEGNNTKSYGAQAHAEGNSTIASGDYTHAEGMYTSAIGSYSHTEGHYTLTSGKHSHAEGKYTTAIGSESHAEGDCTTAYGNGSHTEGYVTFTSGNCSHAEGSNTSAIGFASHAEGNNNIIIGECSHIEGKFNNLTGNTSHIGGYNNNASANLAFIEGISNSANISSGASGLYVLGRENNINISAQMKDINIMGHANNVNIEYDGDSVYGNIIAGSENKYFVSGYNYGNTVLGDENTFYAPYNGFGNNIIGYKNIISGDEKHQIYSIAIIGDMNTVTDPGGGDGTIIMGESNVVLKNVNAPEKNYDAYAIHAGTIMGRSNTAMGLYESLVAGANNSISGDGSWGGAVSVIGHNNVIRQTDTVDSFVAGASITATNLGGSIILGNHSKVDGMYHLVLSTQDGSNVSGYSNCSIGPNLVSGTNNFSIGRANLVLGASNFSIGMCLIQKADNNTTNIAIGQYNVDDTTRIFQIGNGTSDTDRSDALFVDNTGNVSAANYFYDKDGKIGGSHIAEIYSNTNPTTQDSEKLTALKNIFTSVSNYDTYKIIWEATYTPSYGNTFTSKFVSEIAVYNSNTFAWFNEILKVIVNYNANTVSITNLESSMVQSYKIYKIYGIKN